MTCYYSKCKIIGSLTYIYLEFQWDRKVNTAFSVICHLMFSIQNHRFSVGFKSFSVTSTVSIYVNYVNFMLYE